MNEVPECYNFAISHGMWYDISTGDILSHTSATKMIKARTRAANTELKLLALNVMQFAPFMARVSKAKIGKHNVVQMVDRWSPDTFAIQFSDARTRKAVMNTLGEVGLSSFEHQDALIMARKDREEAVNMLTSTGHRVVYKSKDLEAQEFRDSVIQTFQHQSSIKGQDRVFKLSHGDRLLFAICDGHGDDDTINYITQHKAKFTTLISDPFPTSNAEAVDKTSKVFIKFENEMRRAINAQHAGSTMVFAAHDLKTGKVFFGYIGDSRAVFQQDPSSPILATADHKPSDAAETRRIRALGGNITYHKHDVPRVNGNLATSRSFGDESLKSPGEDRTQDLVSVIPDVLGPVTFTSDSVYFLASDGIFDVVSNVEVIEALRSGKEAAEIGPYFAHTARSRGSRDDISVGVVIGV
jgi:protein phosphatase 1L